MIAGQPLNSNNFPLQNVCCFTKLAHFVSDVSLKVGFKYVFELKKCAYLNWKSQNGAYLIFNLVCFEKYLQIIYNQIHIKISILPTKGKSKESRQTIFHTCGMVNCVHAAVRKLAYSQAGERLASMNEWESSETYLHSHKGRYSQGVCFKESCCDLLCKHPGLRQRNPGFLQCSATN